MTTEYIIPSQDSHLSDDVPLHMLEVWQNTDTQWFIQYRFDGETMFETQAATQSAATVIAAQMLEIALQHTLEESALIVDADELVTDYKAANLGGA